MDKTSSETFAVETEILLRRVEQVEAVDQGEAIRKVFESPYRLADFERVERRLRAVESAKADVLAEIRNT